MPKRTPPKSAPAKSISIDQLEQMTTHELADVLSNIVLLLRRMPNVTWQELQSPQNEIPVTSTGAPISVAPVSSMAERAPAVHIPSPSHILLREELEKMLKLDLQEIAKDLNMPISSKMTKGEIINKILSRQSRQDGHSEQYAIQNL